MALKRVFEFCQVCDAELDCVTWDELKYCKVCGEGPFCTECLPKHKVDADNYKLECEGK